MSRRTVTHADLVRAYGVPVPLDALYAANTVGPRGAAEMRVGGGRAYARGEVAREEAQRERMRAARAETLRRLDGFGRGWDS